MFMYLSMCILTCICRRYKYIIRFLHNYIPCTYIIQFNYHLLCSERLRTRTTSSNVAILLDALDTPPAPPRLPPPAPVGILWSSEVIQPRSTRHCRSGLLAQRKHATNTHKRATMVHMMQEINHRDNSQWPGQYWLLSGPGGVHS